MTGHSVCAEAGPAADALTLERLTAETEKKIRAWVAEAAGLESIGSVVSAESRRNWAFGAYALWFACQPLGKPLPAENLRFKELLLLVDPAVAS